ncbi:Uu.00g049750.m01.CDS01 [Anthostomella pinea]|uniref:Uu.00g049750.m01.CDS01 n=1 Tax=Anthostomella pinea TaxID=933095 RepID=A0AAI8VCP5_9PEZI|nr:Uu.00g049750.m01.CDS01 [Anthostomella pinea]
MDALLDPPRSNMACNSVEDLQNHLHNILASKSSDTRAEHSSLTFELRQHTTFHLTEESDNGGADGVDFAQSQQLPVLRTVMASETVQNQPSDDPVLQRAVAKHIVSAMGAVDGSLWTVRQVTRGAQGWTLTYICEDSLQAWNRANAKNAERPVIGGYSGNGGLDPINLSRPAFDCRGTLTIAFSKSSRGVVVKYEHTPLHKSVTQLVERLLPSLPPPPVSNGNTFSQRTPKAKRPPPAEGEEGSRKKRRKKAKAPMDDGAPDTQSATQDNTATQGTSQEGVHLTSIVNVPPAEAERRRLVAIELLTGKDIEPSTLSAEQFNIFANQAPNLQTASLEMLAKYGAERLRIVHPDDNNASGSSTPAQAQSANATPANGTASAAASSETPTKKRRSKKKKSEGAPAEDVSIGDGAVIPLEQTGELGTTESTLKPRVRKTRGSCDTCKQRKVKSENAAEAGGESDGAGEAEQTEGSGQHQAPVPVETQPEPAVVAPPSPSPPPPRQSQPQPQPQTQPDPDNEEFIPDPNILSGPTEHHQAIAAQAAQAASNNYYQPQSTGLTFPAVNHPQPSAGNTSVLGLTSPQSESHGDVSQSSAGFPFPATAHSSQQAQQSQQSQGLTFPTTTAPSSNHNRQASAPSGRRSLPSGQSKQTPVPPLTIPAQASNWNASPSTGHATASAISPTMKQAQAAKRPRSRKSGPEATQQPYEGMKQATAVSQLSQAPAPAPSQQSVVTRSPYQSSARVKSRQGRRSQTGTPVSNAPRQPPPAPQITAHQPATTTASYNTPPTASAIPNYDPYSRYNSGRTNNQYAETTTDHGSSRIAYEPGSYQTNPNPTTTATTTYSAAPSYDYTQRSSTNSLSQALNPSAEYGSSTSSPTSNQWPTSQTRGAQSQSTSSYSMPSAPAPNSHAYETRSSDTRASNQTSSYNQPQSQPYGSYSSQQPNPAQPSQQNWYGFTAANNSSSNSSSNSNNQATYGSNRSSGYGAPRPNVSGYPTYGGSDEQSIYDLLRASGSNN